jgi:hypothetical protein
MGSGIGGGAFCCACMSVIARSLERTQHSRRKIARGFPPARRLSLPLPESHTKIVFYARTK